MSNDCFCTKTYKCLGCERSERAAIILKPKRIPKPRKVAQCGTRAGYNRHIRFKEPTCAPCKAAQAAYYTKKVAV